MKLSEYKNEDALDLLADILDPLSEILMDEGVRNLTKNKETTKMQAVKYLLKEHKKPIIQIMAIMDGVPVDKYEVNFLSLPKKLLEILNDQELIDFFHSQGQMMEKDNSGSAMANTEAAEKV